MMGLTVFAFSREAVPWVPWISTLDLARHPEFVLPLSRRTVTAGDQKRMSRDLRSSPFPPALGRTLELMRALSPVLEPGVRQQVPVPSILAR